MLATGEGTAGHSPGGEAWPSDRPGGKYLADGVKRSRSLNERSQLDLRELEGQES